MALDTPSLTNDVKACRARNSMMFSVNSRSFQVFLVSLVFVIVTGTWEFLVRWLDVPAYVLPGPIAIVEQLWKLFGQNAFWWNFAMTICEVTFGYLLGIVIAVILGVAIALVPLLDRSLMPYVVAFQTIPSVALAPIFLLWFGYGIGSKVVMAAIIAFFPILVNVIAGLQASGRDEIQMLKSFGATKTQILFKVRIPNSLPYVFAGLALGAVFALVGTIVAEFVGAQAGLGKMILQFNEQLNIAGMFAVLIVLAMIGMLMHSAIAYIRKRVVFWNGDN